MLRTRLAKPITEAKSHYHAVVVGSGYGGGVAASRLARAGCEVAVLERGREVLTGDFPARFPDLMREIQITGKGHRRGVRTALFDVRLGEDMHIMAGCGLGGGSLVNAGVARRPDPAVLSDEAWPEEIARDGLIDESYARAEAWLRPASHDDACATAKFQVFDTAVRALGVSAVKAPVVVSFEKTVNAAGLEQPACTLCGDCCAGCNTGAKNTVALTYLADSARAGAELFTHANVRHIEKRTSADGHERWRIFADSLLDDASSPVVLTADTVILAAGTLGSTEILLRSKVAGLSLSDRLGKRFSANGDVIAFGYGARDTVNAVGTGYPAKVPGLNVGSCVSGHASVPDADDFTRSILLSEGVVPSAMAPALPLMFLPNGRILGALQSLISGVYKGPFKNLQTFFAVSHDSASGCLKLDHDQLVLSWPNAKEEPVYARIDAALEAITAHAGSAYVKNPLAGTVTGHQPATAHPLGGCGMGKDRSSGVVNHKSQVFDAGSTAAAEDVHHGLYVIDGSIIPRSIGVNPLLTIAALAERALILLAADHGLNFSVAPANRAGAAQYPPLQGGL